MDSSRWQNSHAMLLRSLWILVSSLAAAEEHLASAEQLTQQKKFESALEEIGSYLGLIDDAREFLGTMNSDKNSTRDLFRHLEGSGCVLVREGPKHSVYYNRATRSPDIARSRIRPQFASANSSVFPILCAELPAGFIIASRYS